MSKMQDEICAGILKAFLYLAIGYVIGVILMTILVVLYG